MMSISYFQFSSYTHYVIFRAHLGSQVSKKKIGMTLESLPQQYTYKLVLLVRLSYL